MLFLDHALYYIAVVLHVASTLLWHVSNCAFVCVRVCVGEDSTNHIVWLETNDQKTEKFNWFGFVQWGTMCSYRVHTYTRLTIIAQTKLLAHLVVANIFYVIKAIKCFGLLAVPPLGQTERHTNNAPTSVSSVSTHEWV